MATENIRDAVRGVLTATREPFIPGRYPHTYAYDFVRANPQAIGLEAAGLISRGEAVGEVADYADRTGQDRMEVLVTLADGYLAKYNLKATLSERIAAMTDRGMDPAVLLRRREAMDALVAFSIEADLDV